MSFWGSTKIREALEQVSGTSFKNAAGTGLSAITGISAESGKYIGAGLKNASEKRAYLSSVVGDATRASLNITSSVATNLKSGAETGLKAAGAATEASLNITSSVATNFKSVAETSLKAAGAATAPAISATSSVLAATACGLSSASTVAGSVLAEQGFAAAVKTGSALVSAGAATSSVLTGAYDYAAATTTESVTALLKSAAGTADSSNVIGSVPAKAIIGAGLAVGGATLLLPAVGFTSAGVAAGSLAAAVHSSIGSVAAGSSFALLQSAGVLGLAASTQAVIGTVGALIAIAGLPNDFPPAPAGAALALAGAAVALPAIHFPSAGLASGSAAVQGSIGSFAAESTSTLLQRARVAGMAEEKHAMISSAESVVPSTL